MLSCALFSSRFNECLDYDNHFCGLKRIFQYFYRQGRDCTPLGVQKYFNGILQVGNGISYSPSRGGIDHVNEDDNVNDKKLLSLKWTFFSQYTKVGEETLLYGFTDLVAWLGGAIGIFVGYSVLDLSNQIIDVIFNCIARLTTTAKNNYRVSHNET